MSPGIPRNGIIGQMVNTHIILSYSPLKVSCKFPMPGAINESVSFPTTLSKYVLHVLLIFSNLIDLKYHLKVVMICIFLMISEMEHSIYT